MSRKSIKAGPDLCCVSVGYMSLVMPAADGVRVMTLLAKAQQFRKEYDKKLGAVYHPEDEPLELGYSNLRADQLVLEPRPAPDAVVPRAIGREPLKLSHY